MGYLVWLSVRDAVEIWLDVGGFEVGEKRGVNSDHQPTSSSLGVSGAAGRSKAGVFHWCLVGSPLVGAAEGLGKGIDSR
jgi:hypothetical protein